LAGIRESRESRKTRRLGCQRKRISDLLHLPKEWPHRQIRTAMTEWSNQNKTTDDKKRNTLVVKKVVVVRLHSIPGVLKRTSLITLEIMIVTQLIYLQKSKTIKKKKNVRCCVRRYLDDE
jgi:hypothetical protein